MQDSRIQPAISLQLAGGLLFAVGFRRVLLACTVLMWIATPTWSAASGLLIQAIQPPAAAESSPLSALDDGLDLVLLKNGQTLQGRAIASVDRTTIEAPSGSRIVLKTSDILHICADWDEAWEFKRDQARVDDPRQLQELFRWTIRNHLFSRAWEVIDQLQMTDLPSRELDLLHRQLLAAEKSHAAMLAQQSSGRNSPALADGSAMNQTGGWSTPPVDAGTTPQRPGDSARSGTGLASNSLGSPPPMTDPAVRPASFSGPAGQSLPLNKPAPFPAIVPDAELDRFLAPVSADQFQQWRRNVEPALIQSCGLSGCHTPASTSWPLTRMGMDGPLPLRISQQNLYRTAWLLLEDPEGTERLVRAATNPHGGASEPPISADSPVIPLLIEWADGIRQSLPSEALPTAPKSSKTVKLDSVPTALVRDNAMPDNAMPDNAMPGQAVMAGSSGATASGAANPDAANASLPQPSRAPGPGRSRVPTLRLPGSSAPAPSGSVRLVSGSGEVAAPAQAPAIARDSAAPPPAAPEIPDLDLATRPFVAKDDFDPGIFNHFLRDAGSESRRAAAALGLPDLQPLIGKQKSPAK